MFRSNKVRHLIFQVNKVQFRDLPITSIEIQTYGQFIDVV